MSRALLLRALARRSELFARLHDESTDCYRLFHGVAEGRPGLTLDRYGPLLLAQTWRERLSADDLEIYRETIEHELAVPLIPIWNHREGDVVRSGDPPEHPVARELSLRYDVSPHHSGHDPLLFLDLRAGRRLVRKLAGGKRVLNLFAYTGGVSLCAASAGATEVWHVDFARQAELWCRRNFELNGIPLERVRFVREDALCVLRQLAGLPIKGRGAKGRSYERVPVVSFDLVILDPPRWSKGAFGAVDVVRDYPSLLKPALLATSPGGRLIVTNNAARVPKEEWIRVLRRTGEKCGRGIAELTLVEPEEDFPSLDGEPPLKIAMLEMT